MRPSFAIAIAIAFALGIVGCVPSYTSLPPLEFEALRYVSVDGRPWPVRRVSLPGVNRAYELPEATSVSVVELNPEGKQTLVFLHGLGSYLKFWQYQLDRFASRGHRVIAIDMLGYGKSDKPATFPYSTEAMAEVVREVVGQLTVERPVLVGHSMGGQIALAYAIRWPDALSALVLASPAGFEAFSKREQAWFRDAFTPALIKSAGEEAIWGNVSRANFARWREAYAWLVEERVRLAGAGAFDSYAYANVRSVYGLADNRFVRDHLGRVTVKTLIVYGDQDRLIPNPFLHGGTTRSIMEFGRAGIPGAKLVEFAGCGHRIQIDCADAVNRTLDGFLGAISAP